MPPPPQPSLDFVSTIRDDGSRRYLFPADVSGRFTRARAGAALVLIAIYLLLPWIKVGGYPAVFLDVAERRFHFFGWTPASQTMGASRQASSIRCSQKCRGIMLLYHVFGAPFDTARELLSINRVASIIPVLPTDVHSFSPTGSNPIT